MDHIMNGFWMLVWIIDEGQTKRNEEQPEISPEDDFMKSLCTVPLTLNQSLNGFTSVEFYIIVDDVSAKHLAQFIVIKLIVASLFVFVLVESGKEFFDFLTEDQLLKIDV